MDAALTPRQVQVLEAVVLSASEKCAAAQLGITVNTVHSHMARIRRRLGVANTAQAVYIATRDGLLEAPSHAQP
jgi:DNA-binding NarL/FixJ family response regulator